MGQYPVKFLNRELSLPIHISFIIPPSFFPYTILVLGATRRTYAHNLTRTISDPLVTEAVKLLVKRPPPAYTFNFTSVLGYVGLFKFSDKILIDLTQLCRDKQKFISNTNVGNF